MTATGTSSAASAIVARILAGRAPASSAKREASWITPPSITGSENGIPTSIGVGARVLERAEQRRRRRPGTRR